MKRIQLVKAAIDFAFAHYQDGAVTLAIESATVFKALPGADEDFQLWQGAVAQSIAQFSMASKQKLPSEIKAQSEPVAQVSNAAAVTPKSE
jgi:hypothetical protein